MSSSTLYLHWLTGRARNPKRNTWREELPVAAGGFLAEQLDQDDAALQTLVERLPPHPLQVGLLLLPVQLERLLELLADVVDVLPAARAQNLNTAPDY